MTDDRSLHHPLPAEPLTLLARWLDESRGAPAARDGTDRITTPAAMMVATADADGRPSSRMVLCRGYDAQAGHVVFHTNRGSRKGRELTANPRAAALFFWDGLHRQVRIEGPVVPSPEAESDDYWNARPRAARLSALASDQSAPLPSRDDYRRRVAELEARHGTEDEGAEPVPRPPHWGGYRILIERIELWVGDDARRHDRGVWTREVVPGAHGIERAGPWSVERLQP